MTGAKHTTGGDLGRWRRGPLGAIVCVLLIASGTTPHASVGSERGRGGDVPNLVAIEKAFQRVVDRVSPSVVGIRAYRTHVSSLGGGLDSGVGQRVLVNGSGMIISADGLVLTNEHVVQAATEIIVVLHDGTELTAMTVSSDRRSDLAVLRVFRSGLRPVEFCKWNDVARGQWAIVVGNPFGLGGDGQLSVAIGVVSNLGRQLPGLGEVDDRFYNDMIQTTASIHPGHSGGALFNVHGEVIGIVTAMHTRAPADEGIGFAVPLTPTKRRVIDRLSDGDEIEYGYLGLEVRVPERSERHAIGLDRGVVVQQVEPGGPAEKAGIAVGDAISAFDGQAITGPAQLAEIAGQTPVGVAVQVEIIRGGQRMTVVVVVAERDVSRVSWMRDRVVLWRGMRVADLTEDVREIMGAAAPRGVLVIDVLPGSPASRADVRIGQVIEAIAGIEIEDTTDFLQQTRNTRRSIQVRIHNRGDRSIAASSQ